jgi:hypothetical protein
MVSNGTSTPDTEIAIANLKNALSQTDIRLKGSEEDLSLVSNNLNKTLTTTGGSSLSMDDLNDMRYRVDNAMASGLMQAEFDKAAETFAYTDYVYDKKANPFQVNLENHGYRMSEQNARAKAAWDLTLLKSGLKKEELMLEAKKDSGNYVLVEDADGNTSFQKNPLLNMILPNKGTKARTAGGTDTKQVQEQIMDALGLEPKLTKTIAIDLLRELNAEGTLSDESILKIVGNKGLTNEWERSITKFLQNYVVDPDNDWTTNKYTKNSPALKRKTKENMVRQGIYETSLEREDRLSMEKEEKKKPSKERVRENLEKVSKADIDDLKPEEINGFVQRLFTELSSKQYRDMPGIKNNPKVESLLVKSFQLQDYAAFLNSVKKSKEETAKIIINRLDADGFKYSDQLFDENWDKRSEKEWKAFIASTTPNDLINSSGMTWSGFLTSAATAGTTAGGLGLIGGPLAGLSFIGGTIAGGAAYVGTGLMGWAYNSFIANQMM